MKSGIFIVSYAKDLPFFAACARSVEKFARGFARAVVAVPHEDVEAFRAVAGSVEVVGRDEVPGKGMLTHKVAKIYADEYLPDCEVIFHLDSDCVFAAEATPEDWVSNGKLLMPYESFGGLLTNEIQPGEEKVFQSFRGLASELDRNRYSRRSMAEWTLGLTAHCETMLWNPIAHRRAVYAKARKTIADRHKVPVADYILSCRNEFPFGFPEFLILGTVAQYFFEPDYKWILLQSGAPLPHYKSAISWSHGGLDHLNHYPDSLGGPATPRQLFSKLGLC